MLNYNSVTILGQLGKDAKMKEFKSKAGSNYRVLRFNVCANHTTYTSSGDKRETAEWFHCVQSFNADTKGKYPAQLDYLHENLLQGVPVHVTGRLQTREFKGKEGTESITEVLTNGKGSISVLASSSSSSGTEIQRGGDSSGGKEISRDDKESTKSDNDLEDDEPF